VPTPTTAGEAAAAVAAGDLFVLRRVSGSTFVHFGGVGRGQGWAGLIELDVDDEESFRSALAADGPVRVGSGEMRRIFGPYYAPAAAFVPVTQDIVVVLGSGDPAFRSVPDEELASASRAAADAVGEVTPAKRLADELEVLDALRTLIGVDETWPLPRLLEHVAEAAATALSCEVGIVYLEGNDQVGRWERDRPIDAGPGELAAVMRGLLERTRFPHCEQDAYANPLPPPLAAGVRSYYLLELAGQASGLLLLLHTDAAPRGFTLLCRRLGLHLADAASSVIGVALTKDYVAREANRLHVEFGHLPGASRSPPGSS
jgi:hypothetical protein